MINKSKEVMPERRKVLLLVGVGVMAEGYLQAAQQRDLDVAVVETSGRLKELRSKFSCIVEGEEVKASVCLDEAWVLPALNLAKRVNPAAVLGFAEPQIMSASIVQEELGLPGPSVRAATVSRNKATQRSLFENAGIDQPEWILVGGLGEAKAWATSRFPVVVKPLSRMGSSGVERIDDDASWKDALCRRGTEGPLLVEEYIEGDEFSIEALISEGRIIFSNITRKTTSGAPHFVELAHVAGYAVEQPDLAQDALVILQKVVKKIGVQSSIVHLEFKRRPSGRVAVIEIAVRTPGDHIMELIFRSYDFNIYAAALDLAFGNELQDVKFMRRVQLAGVQYVDSTLTGKINNIRNLAWDQIPGYERSHIMKKTGDSVKPASETRDRVGYVIITQPTLKSLETSMRSVVESFFISVS
ncbi:ATP-grasp domain-containing protein [Halomonas eurihalina]|uniref:ATP-grasp domain-containing protein n=1 Tax=Halomonas eurihalina TaxID=42566 RepID=A0A5D9DBD0_HALER|nr:ATP-grasp domain-containing protein [Halomonas eurihalina]MDR5859267.1 ATP-grasp domain-containing protein [Halomonas eurihalina]TZG40909.1 ATP-grasp domain-containing protein [Halomonas eurihalina]